MPSRPRPPARSGLAVAFLVVTVSLGVLFLTAPNAAAITYVRGAITTDTIWGIADSEYVLTGSVFVRPGVSLTILPGTSVKMDPGVALYVEGLLSANGNPGNPIAFTPNNTASLLAPVGVRFNASSAGSVSWSTFDRYNGPLHAEDSSPAFQDNTITSATVGIRLIRSSGFVLGNTVNRATLGILLEESDAQVAGNTVNGTSPFGIQMSTSGAPFIFGNTVTNVTGLSFLPAVGIYATAGTSPTIQFNVVDGVQGVRGASPLFAGANGTAGGVGVGILTDGTATVAIEGNTVTRVLGGRGGDGAPNFSGAGGSGGAGGDAAGIVAANAADVTMSGNMITTIAGGRGGQGGGGGGTILGGNGGDGASAAAAYVLVTSTSALVDSNFIDGVTAGSGGNGGDVADPGLDGDGGSGGDGLGIFAADSRDVQIQGNMVQSIRGGWAGNSTAAGGNGLGGLGGDGSGVFALGIAGSALFHFNAVYSVIGGAGGRGSTGGSGGNGTSLGAIGYDDGLFNETTASGNWLELATGGVGGFGDKAGGAGGGGAGLVFALVSASSAGNAMVSVTGGAGGNAGDGSDGGRGGDATGFLGYTIGPSSSTGDTVFTVTRGAAGAGAPVQARYARGYYAAGNATAVTELTIENATILAVGDYDLWVDNYTDAITINTPFDPAANVEATGTLTVRNFLRVETYWPDGTTPVAGASILVTDEGTTAYSLTSSSGIESWLLVTDRIYVNSDTATENETEVDVAYLSYSFGSDPRLVAMDASHTETFIMDDSDPPTSAASPLPAYRNALTFDVNYTASDGNGGGLNNITLWYRLDGAGWTRDATQAASGAGTFTFTAISDGTYEFATTADDVAGNTEPGPSANDTWTIVDTVRPGSSIAALPTYETTASFLVSWAPDGGVADIVAYTIQYDRGAGWVTWLAGTTATSGIFTADPAFGVYEFRSIATDAAGNAEIPPAGNDTWTLVDTERPTSAVSALSNYQTSLTFNVFWGPSGDSFDIATYRIDVNDNGGGWTAWIASTANTSGAYTGVDGHVYQFRSIATDRAGNVETGPSGNDTWTRVDVTPPDSRVTALPAYHTNLQFTVSWGPVPGTTDITTYTLEVSDNGGAWTPVSGSINTPATTAVFVGADGHAYAFRTLARDRAGNLETAPAGNDTWTTVDVTRPFATTGSPRGANVNGIPPISVTFSEPMDRASVEQAFSLSPDMNGAFAWSADSRTVTFTPDRALEAGTRYVVAVDSSARDIAGNTATGLYTFDFTTVPVAFGILDMWWVFAAIGVAVGGSLFFLLMRRRGAAAEPRSASFGKSAAAHAGAAAPVSQATIDDVFLLYRDGVLIKHETRRLKPDIDTDILSGMLTAVQQFVKDSFRTEEGELDELTFGQMHILIGRGKYLILAAMIQGDGTESFTAQIKKTIQDIEDHHWDQLDDWDGDMVLAKVLTPYVKKLIRGDYL